MKLAFIGLGVMGYPMAGHLAAAGHEMRVFNRTSSRAEAWCQEHSGSRHATPADAASGADAVLCCVGNDDDVRAVLLGEDGAIAGLSAGAMVIDHTTASETLAKELHAACAARDIEFIDAPVSGGQAGAESGQLSIMIGGDEAAVERGLAIMQPYAKAATRIGPVGSGQLAKMANQICIAGVVQGLSEALAFSQAAGLDVASVVRAISQGAAQSWQMDNRWATMVDGEFDFGFAVDWMRKDLSMALQAGDANGVALELTRLVDSYYAEVQAMGGARWDTSSLIARLNKA